MYCVNNLTLREKVNMKESFILFVKFVLKNFQQKLRKQKGFGIVETVVIFMMYF